MKEKCLGTSYQFGNEKKEEVGTSDVTVNIVELASNLAHNMTKEVLMNKEEIQGESDMWIESSDSDPDDRVMMYPEKIQDLFNHWYDYFYDEIEQCKI